MGKGSGTLFQMGKAPAAQASSGCVAHTFAAKPSLCQTDPLPCAPLVGVKCQRDFLPWMGFFYTSKYIQNSFRSQMPLCVRVQQVYKLGRMGIGGVI